MAAGDTIMFKWWNEYGHDDFVYQISFSNWPEGEETEEEITSLSLIEDNFSIYPNPTTGIVHLSTNSDAEIQVFNVQGELLITTTSSKIDLSEHPSGIYFIQQEGISQKIIKK